MRIIIAMILMSLFQFAYADCFDKAANGSPVDTLSLRAIAKVESNTDPKKIHHNHNGSVDYGMMQINSSNLKTLKKKHIHVRDLMNACKNVKVGASMLEDSYTRYGSMNQAIIRYNPGDRHYLSKIKKAKVQIRHEMILDDFANNRPFNVALE